MNGHPTLRVLRLVLMVCVAAGAAAQAAGAASHAESQHMVKIYVFRILEDADLREGGLNAAMGLRGPADKSHAQQAGILTKGFAFDIAGMRLKDEEGTLTWDGRPEPGDPGIVLVTATTLLLCCRPATWDL